jgi:hypothetical protein
MFHLGFAMTSASDIATGFFGSRALVEVEPC